MTQVVSCFPSSPLLICWKIRKRFLISDIQKCSDIVIPSAKWRTKLNISGGHWRIKHIPYIFGSPLVLWQLATDCRSRSPRQSVLSLKQVSSNLTFFPGSTLLTCHGQEQWLSLPQMSSKHLSNNSQAKTNKRPEPQKNPRILYMKYYWLVNSDPDTGLP